MSKLGFVLIMRKLAPTDNNSVRLHYKHQELQKFWIKKIQFLYANKLEVAALIEIYFSRKH